MKLNVCTTSGAVVTTSLIILCAVFTFVTVDFGASNNPQRSLEWLFSSELRPQITEVFSDTTNHPPFPPSQLPENASAEVESQLGTAPELAETPRPAPSPLEEAIPPRADVDHVETVEDEETFMDSAPSPSEREFDGNSGDWDSVDEESAEERDQQSGTSSTKWNYDVCLLVTMGRSRTERGALPYSELYRLFNAAKRLQKGKIFVGTNSDRTILCRMVRDALGPSAECSSFDSVGVTTNKCKHVVVGATAKYIPQPLPSALRKYGFQWETMESVDLDTEDAARNPPSLPESEWRPTVVTGFSSNHVEVGLLLLRSLGRVAIAQSEFNVSVVVWTMDHFPQIALKALACVVAELQTVYKVQAEVREFDFRAWPPWMRINQRKGYNGGRGEYAWKAVMIHTVLVDRGFVYWADAGDRFKSVAGLTQTLRNVKLKGFASRHSSGHVKDWTHPMQLKYFGANNANIKKQPNCDASGIGFTLSSYSKLARPWYECSITRQCIAPDGSSRKNHRQDQSALTVLVILTGTKCEGVNSGIVKNMDNQPNSHRVGVDATKCYKDPLGIKWQRKLM